MLRNINCLERLNLQLTIEQALKRTIQPASLVKQEEPDYIAALCLNFTKELYNILKFFFRGYSFSTVGLFCHQKPMAKFKDGHSCEIGDLLFVYIYRDKTGGEYYNALLLQAKKSKSEKLKLSSKDELRQLDLYSKWPKFTYWRANELNNTERDIMPKIFNSGAKYLLIDPTVDILSPYALNEYIFGTALANNPLVLTNQLSLELIDFIGFKAGRVFEKRPQDICIKDETWTNDEWSKLIWDIININKCAKANRKNICTKGFPRSTVAEFNDLGNNNNYINYKYQHEEPAGIPMIIIECQEWEQSQR